MHDIKADYNNMIQHLAVATAHVAVTINPDGAKALAEAADRIVGHLSEITQSRVQEAALKLLENGDVKYQ